MREELSARGSARTGSSVSSSRGIKRDPAFIALVKRSERMAKKINKSKREKKDHRMFKNDRAKLQYQHNKEDEENFRDTLRAGL